MTIRDLYILCDNINGHTRFIVSYKSGDGPKTETFDCFRELPGFLRNAKIITFSLQGWKVIVDAETEGAK